MSLQVFQNVVERQAQLISGDPDLKLLSDLQSDLAAYSLTAFNEEQLQLFGGFLVQALQEEDLVLLGQKLCAFQRRQLHKLKKVQKIPLPLSAAKWEGEGEHSPQLPPIPYGLQQFYDEIQDGVADKINEEHYKPVKTKDEMFDAMPYNYALRLYKELRHMHALQRSLTICLPPSAQKSENKVVFANSTTKRAVKQLDDFCNTARNQLNSVKEIAVSEYIMQKPQKKISDFKNRILYEFGSFNGDSGSLKVNNLRNAVVFRNGFKDMELAIQKIKDKYPDADVENANNINNISVEQLLQQYGLCCEGDHIEHVISYTEGGRRAYRPMQLKKKEFSTNLDKFDLTAVGIYQIGKLSGQESELLDFQKVRRAYPYNPALAYKWEQYVPGKRVDVLQTESATESSSEWIEGFVIEQDLKTPKIIVEIPNYENHHNGTKIIIQNLQNIRISMDFVFDTWQFRSIKSIIPEIADLQDSENWWKFPFGQKITDVCKDFLLPHKEKATELLQDWCDQEGRLDN